MDVIRIPHGKDDRDHHEDPFQVVPEHEARFSPQQQEAVERKAEGEYNPLDCGDDIIYIHEGCSPVPLVFHAFPGILEGEGEMEDHRCPADDRQEQHREYRDVVREPVEFQSDDQDEEDDKEGDRDHGQDVTLEQLLVTRREGEDNTGDKGKGQAHTDEKEICLKHHCTDRDTGECAGKGR